METKDKRIKVAMYCRMATATDGGPGIEKQKEQLRQYAEQQGYDIVKEIIEIAKGDTLERAGIREICSMARRHAMDKVLAVNMERFGRKTEDVLRLEDNLKKQNVRMDTPQGNPLAGYGEMVRAFGRRYME